MAVTLERTGDQRFPPISVSGLEKDRLPGIAAKDNVIEASGDVQSWGAWHRSG